MNTYPAHIRNPTLSQMLWFMPVIPATWEAQIKRIRSVPKVLRPHLNRKKFWCGSVPATVESLKWENHGPGTMQDPIFKITRVKGVKHWKHGSSSKAPASQV
jgi:hypothetical protein